MLKRIAKPCRRKQLLTKKPFNFGHVPNLFKGDQRSGVWTGQALAPDGGSGAAGEEKAELVEQHGSETGQSVPI